MRAHVAKAVKARCAEKKIQPVVIPGGMPPYLQAGDIGIYKSFKDNISPVIDAWKASDHVQYTKHGNPKPPAVEEVARWVEDAWNAVPDEVVQKSILGAGFADNFEDWHIARHDVYGDRFRDAWMNREENVEIDEDISLMTGTTSDSLTSLPTSLMNSSLTKCEVNKIPLQIKYRFWSEIHQFW